MPDIGAATQAALRTSYGVLLLATLLLALPNWRRFFAGEEDGGYADEGSFAAARLVAVVWLSSALLLASGRLALLAAAVNLALCHHYFVRSRWTSLARGLGAPGYLAYWLGGAVFLLEAANAYFPGLRPLVVLALQVDFALIMLSAGLAKLASGYASGRGMELGMANPMWGYWWKASARLDPRAAALRVLNHLAWGLELAAGLLMLAPFSVARLSGALLIALSFLFVLTQIRLGPLCPMVLACCLLFFPAPAAPLDGPKAVAALLWAYIALRPLATFGLVRNFYFKKRLPEPLQRALDAYCGFFGVILWRVFTPDVTDFYVLVYEGTTLVSRYDDPLDWRYNNVCEAIAVTSIFTTLKYFPSDRARFETKLRRYAKTVPCAPGGTLVFRWVSVLKEGGRFVHHPAAEFEVDPRTGKIDERRLSSKVDVRAPAAVEARAPGSYAPR